MSCLSSCSSPPPPAFPPPPCLPGLCSTEAVWRMPKVLPVLLLILHYSRHAQKAFPSRLSAPA